MGPAHHQVQGRSEEREEGEQDGALLRPAPAGGGLQEEGRGRSGGEGQDRGDRQGGRQERQGGQGARQARGAAGEEGAAGSGRGQGSRPHRRPSRSGVRGVGLSGRTCDQVLCRRSRCSCEGGDGCEGPCGGARRGHGAPQAHHRRPGVRVADVASAEESGGAGGGVASRPEEGQGRPQVLPRRGGQTAQGADQVPVGFLGAVGQNRGVHGVARRWRVPAEVRRAEEQLRRDGRGNGDGHLPRIPEVQGRGAEGARITVGEGGSHVRHSDHLGSRD
mmetsp:Transcript_64389/g.153596  ORF Transcript_64389/g.153596 Transcript_64389/m.153596 type:complete len:276 (+) Transcript_64389:1202-2029(+)